MMNSSPRRGRRAGAPDTRAEILAAARERFIATGYNRTTMRAIAERAGCDVALISYYFGSKHGVFTASMALAVSPGQVLTRVLEGDVEDLPRRILAAAIKTWDDPENWQPLRELLTLALQDPTLLRGVREYVEHEVVGRLAERIGGPDATARAVVAAVQVGGLIFARYLLAVEPIASMDAGEVGRRLAPAMKVALLPPRAMNSPAGRSRQPQRG